MSDYLLDLSADSSNHKVWVLVRCPICDEEIVDADECGIGKKHPEIVEEHIQQHEPDELGLDEYQFRPMADILMELHGLGRERKEAL